MMCSDVQYRSGAEHQGWVSWQKICPARLAGVLSEHDQLLEQAFLKASELDPAEQDRLAQGILAELEDEAQWEKAFASPESQNMLSSMARKALADLNARRGVQGTPDEL